MLHNLTLVLIAYDCYGEKYQKFMMEVLPFLVHTRMHALSLRQSMVCISVCTILLTLGCQNIAAQTSATLVTPYDSAQKKNLYMPLERHGRLLLTATRADYSVSKYDLKWSDYNSLGEILAEHLPAFPLFLGAQGMMNSFAIFGATPRDIALTYNGRSLNDPVLGTALLEQFPPEFMERAEIMLGSDAVIMGDNASGALINLQEIRYNTAKPYSRIWFHQGGSDYLASDGVFSQNIAQNVNFTIGWRRQFSAGRLQNQRLNAWNLRMLLRWNMSERTNVSFTHLFTSHIIGTNGGVDTTIANGFVNFTPTGAVTFRTNDGERVNRHDASLTLTSYLSADTANAVSLTAYGSLGLWQRTRLDRRSILVRTSVLSDTVVAQDYTTRQFGVRGHIETHLPFLNVQAGGRLEIISSDSAMYFDSFTRGLVSGFGRLELLPFEHIRLSGGMRISLMNSALDLSLGGRLTWVHDSSLTFFADLSRSFRSASHQEGVALANESHILLLGGLRYKSPAVNAELLGFFRNVQQPIVAQPIYESTRATLSNNVIGTSFVNTGSRTALGVTANGSVRLGNILADGFAQAVITQTNGTNDRRFPALYAGLSVQYEYAVGRSTLHGGVRFRMMTGFRGERFIPQTWSYTEQTYYEQAPQTNGLDLIGGAVIGNVFLRVTMQNVLSTAWWYVPIQPMYDQNIRLSVSWAFTE